MMLDKWVGAYYFGLNQADERLSRGRIGTWIEYDKDGLCYYDIGTCFFSWDSYVLIQ